MFSLESLSKSKFFTRVALAWHSRCSCRWCRTREARAWYSCYKIGQITIPIEQTLFIQKQDLSLR